MTKKELLKQIKDYYIHSHDFNGMPVYDMEEYCPELLIDLVNDGLIEVISEHEVNNPHIKGFDLSNLPKEIQLQRISEKGTHTCFYPTRKALKNIKPDYQKPYKALLQYGAPQFRLIYFNIEILQIYLNNPKFQLIDFGYSGQIVVEPEYINDDTLDCEYVKSYGMAYERENSKINRAVAVFVRDLSRLSASTQMRWKSYELPNQEAYAVEVGFYQNQVMGEFVHNCWMLDAILDEMCVINELCVTIGLPVFFRKTYDTNHRNKPTDYSTLLFPTKKNYYDFVLVLEKLLVHNVNIKVFVSDCGIIRGVERKDKEGNEKGSLVLFKEWLLKNVKSDFDMEQVIIEPLKSIRKTRQTPAHEMYDNKFDVDLYEEQRVIVEQLYEPLYALRRLFMGHPLCRKVQIPEHLLDRDKIVFY
jgi:hypothetical protein